jgi:hypothetical protein
MSGYGELIGMAAKAIGGAGNKEQPQAQAPIGETPEQQSANRHLMQQQMGKDGQAQMQQTLMQGLQGAQNPDYKDMSQVGNFDNLMKMIMGGGNNGRW